MELISKKTVVFSDLDANGHLYNANYADVATDALTLDEYNKELELFHINYINEAKYGDVIELYKIKKGNSIFVKGKIEDKDCFVCEFSYKNL